MAVITISRQLGSQGAEIGRGLAQSLGYHLLERDELQRLFHQYGLIEFDRVYDGRPGFPGTAASRHGEVVRLLFGIMRAVAAHGDSVIVGRCGYAALQGFDDVLNVRVQAPLVVRARHAREEHLVPAGGDAVAEVRARDAARMAFVESCGVRWDSTESFDLVVDTGKIPATLAVSVLAHAVRALPTAPGRTGRRAADLAVDPVMAAAVTELLGCRTAHGEPDEAQVAFPDVH